MLDNIYFYGNYEDESSPVTVECSVCGDVIELDEEYLELYDINVCTHCIREHKKTLSQGD